MKGMTLIVKQVTKLVVGFIFIVGAYIILYGHLTPRGGPKKDDSLRMSHFYYPANDLSEYLLSQRFLRYCTHLPFSTPLSRSLSRLPRILSRTLA